MAADDSIEGRPADMVKVVENYAAWLAETDVPKLYINAEPGSILDGRQRELCRAWPNQTEVTVKGRHLVQEDSPDEIGTRFCGAQSPATSRSSSPPNSSSSSISRPLRRSA